MKTACGICRLATVALTLALSLTAAYALTPRNPAVDLAAAAGRIVIANAQPRFSWSFDSTAEAEKQTAYQIQVTTAAIPFREEGAELWDSGKVESDSPLNIVYAGNPLPPKSEIRWRVRVWDHEGRCGAWSPLRAFYTAEKLVSSAPATLECRLRHVAPSTLTNLSAHSSRIEFDRTAWGWLEFLPPERKFTPGPYSIAFEDETVKGFLTNPGIYRVPLTAQPANTAPTKAGTPAPVATQFGTVRPIRTADVTANFSLTRARIRMIALDYPSSPSGEFVASSSLLARRYGELAEALPTTLFTGCFIDGETNRICRETSAILQAEARAAIDAEATVRRTTLTRLIDFPGHGALDAHHLAPLAWSDYLATGDDAVIAARYEAIAKRTQLAPTNTALEVALKIRALKDLASLAAATGHDAIKLQAAASQMQERFFATTFDHERGRFRAEDPAATRALNAVALACDLCPVEYRKSVGDFCADNLEVTDDPLVNRSLMDALFKAERDEAAFYALLHAPLSQEPFASIAPLAHFARDILGVQPLKPGFARVKLEPHLGTLAGVYGTVPTARGEIRVSIRRREEHYRIDFTLPPGVTAELALPNLGAAEVELDGDEVAPLPLGDKRLGLLVETSGSHSVEISRR